VAAKSAAILDRHSTRWRSRTAVGAEEWLRRGQTKEWARKQVSCQDFVITIREGRHQFSWHKKQEQSRISPSDTVVVLMDQENKYEVLIVTLSGPVFDATVSFNREHGIMFPIKTGLITTVKRSIRRAYQLATSWTFAAVSVFHLLSFFNSS
jgi:hypothetical protein